MKRDVFFIGWAPRTLRPIAGFLCLVVVLGLCALGGLALAVGTRIDDPGSGDFVGEATVVGVLVEHPYPFIVSDPDAAHPAGHAVLLSGDGKQGVQPDAARLAGQRVEATGVMVRRGAIDMLLVNELRPAAANAAAASPPGIGSLGRWRITGEICDGKCVAGVMRPGAGLAHKACANICIVGGLPPVLVTTAPVAGSRVLLMGSPENRALPDAFRDHVGVPRRMEGTVARVGDMLVFQTDVSAAMVP